MKFYIGNVLKFKIIINMKKMRLQVKYDDIINAVLSQFQHSPHPASSFTDKERLDVGLPDPGGPAARSGHEVC